MLGASTLATASAVIASALIVRPQVQAGSDLDRELSRHPFFSCVLHVRIDSRPPYVFVLQQTGKGESNAVLVSRYADVLDPTLALFERELAQPLGLERRGDQRLVVAVLGSPGSLQDFRDVAGGGEHFECRGLYDPMLNAAVLFENPFHRIVDLRERQLSERHAFLHACQQAWFAPGQKAPTASWILEALACELARRDPDAPGRPVAPPAEDLRRFLLDLQDENLRWPHGRTLEELCTISEPANLPAFLEKSAGKLSPDIVAAERAFHRQATLYLHFLLEGAGRRYREGCLGFLKQVFAGHADWATCARSFQPASGTELDETFLAWALKSYQASASRNEIDSAVVQRALRREELPQSQSSSRAAAPGPPAIEAGIVLGAPGLAVDLATAPDEQLLALALYELGRGRAQAGLKLLDDLERSTDDDAMRARAQRERKRAAAWIELRDSFLRSRLGSQAEIEFTYKGNKLKSRVLGFADGKLSLEKHAPASLGPDLIDPFELARQIKPSGDRQDWARLYPYVLQQKKNAAELLHEDGGEASALLADIRADYPERLHLAGILGRLQQCAERDLPEKASDAEKQIEELASWRRDAEGLPLLEEKRPAIRDQVRALMTRVLDAHEPKQLLRGKLTVRKDGSALLGYEFDDPLELQDFSSENYPSLLRGALGMVKCADVPFHVEGGQLVGGGQVWLRSFVDFAAPLSVRYSVAFDETQAERPKLNWGLGVCADGAGHYLLATGRHRLQCYDLTEKPLSERPPEPLFMGIEYAMELRLDDRSLATLICDGESLLSRSTGSLASGAFFLCTSTEVPVRIERLEIEGRLSDLTRLKRARIEQQLAQF